MSSPKSNNVSVKPSKKHKYFLRNLFVECEHSLGKGKSLRIGEDPDVFEVVPDPATRKDKVSIKYQGTKTPPPQTLTVDKLNQPIQGVPYYVNRSFMEYKFEVEYAHWYL